MFVDKFQNFAVQMKFVGFCSVLRRMRQVVHNRTAESDHGAHVCHIYINKKQNTRVCANKVDCSHYVQCNETGGIRCVASPHRRTDFTNTRVCANKVDCSQYVQCSEIGGTRCYFIAPPDGLHQYTGLCKQGGLLTMRTV